MRFYKFRLSFAGAHGNIAADGGGDVDFCNGDTSEIADGIYDVARGCEYAYVASTGSGLWERHCVV